MFKEIDSHIETNLPEGSYLHCLVNNAGLVGISAEEKAAAGFDPITVPGLNDKVERLHRANVNGPLYCIQEFVNPERL